MYWSYTESNWYCDIHFSGTVTHEFYNMIHSDKYKDKECSFGEVVDNMGEVEFIIEELDFLRP